MKIISDDPKIYASNQWTQFGTITSALCDALITVTIWWFLRSARTAKIRYDSLRKLMGLTHAWFFG
jgi:hypothetical protein